MAAAEGRGVLEQGRPAKEVTTSPAPSPVQLEDLIDRLVVRRLARLITLPAARLGWHPNVISFLGMGLGVAAALLFLVPENRLAGCGLLALSYVFDNADGDLARLTGRVSKFGHILDGLCDNVVFFSLYICLIFGLWPELGPLALLLVPLGGISHSLQSAMVDLFKHEMRYWGLGRAKARFRPQAELAQERRQHRGFDAFCLRVEESYIQQQLLLAPWRLRRAALWQSWQPEPAFRRAYVALNKKILHGWFLMGPGWHILLLSLCTLVGQTVLFLWLEITLWNGILALLLLLQRRQDWRLAELFQGGQAVLDITAEEAASPPSL